MSLVSGIAVYVMIWWTVLFAVLPIGTSPDPESDPQTGGWRGLPQRARLPWKMAVTTLVSAVIWLGAYALIESDWLSFRSGWLALPEK